LDTFSLVIAAAWVIQLLLSMLLSSTKKSFDNPAAPINLLLSNFAELTKLVSEQVI
jgi:hypothetical protein